MRILSTYPLAQLLLRGFTEARYHTLSHLRWAAFASTHPLHHRLHHSRHSLLQNPWNGPLSECHEDAAAHGSQKGSE